MRILIIEELLDKCNSKNTALEVECLYMVRAKRERYFAAVVKIMFNGAPDYRLTREVRRILALPIHKHIL